MCIFVVVICDLPRRLLWYSTTKLWPSTKRWVCETKGFFSMSCRYHWSTIQYAVCPSFELSLHCIDAHQQPLTKISVLIKIYLRTFNPCLILFSSKHLLSPLQNNPWWTFSSFLFLTDWFYHIDANGRKWKLRHFLYSKWCWWMCIFLRI